MQARELFERCLRLFFIPFHFFPIQRCVLLRPRRINKGNYARMREDRDLFRKWLFQWGPVNDIPLRLSVGATGCNSVQLAGMKFSTRREATACTKTPSARLRCVVQRCDSEGAILCGRKALSAWIRDTGKRQEARQGLKKKEIG